jgi:hypothetical protein
MSLLLRAAFPLRPQIYPNIAFLITYKNLFFSGFVFLFFPCTSMSFRGTFCSFRFAHDVR